jgi:hypothetical protein
MEKIEAKNARPFEYMVYNSEGELEIYSSGFTTQDKAIEWYDKHGVWLENQFNRRLVLIENVEVEAQTYLWNN